MANLQNELPNQINVPSNLNTQLGRGGGAHVPLSTTLTPPQRAAIVLLCMGKEAAQPIIETMSDTHLKTFFKALEQMQTVPRKDLLAVIADFITTLEKQKGQLRAGPNKARELAESLLDDARASNLLGSPVQAKAKTTNENNIWNKVSDLPMAKVVEFLNAQSVQVCAYVLSQLPDDKTGELVTELADDVAVSVVEKLSSKMVVSDHARRAIERLVDHELFASSAEGNDDADSGAIDFVSSMLSVVSPEKRNLMLDGLEKRNPERAKKIRNGMLIFEDLATRMPPTGVQIIFKDYPKDQLLSALKAGANISSETVEFLLGNISQRMAEQYKEEIEEMDELAGKAADKAISSFMGFISRLKSEGRITLLAASSATDDTAA